MTELFAMFALGAVLGSVWTRFLLARPSATIQSWVVAIARHEATLVANKICNVRVPPPSERPTLDLKPGLELPLEERPTCTVRHPTVLVVDRSQS